MATLSSDALPVGAVWSAPTSALRIDVLARAALSRLAPPASCPHHLAALSAALEVELLPFGTDLYADLFRRQARVGEWTAAFLLTRAQRKADGARRLQALALAARDPAERALLASLAVLDSDHVRDTLALFDLTFPRALEAADRAALDALCPEYAEDPALSAGESAPTAARARPPDDVLDLYLDRLRSVVHCLLLAELLPAWVASDTRPRVESALGEAAAGELTAAGRLASFLEVVTAGTPAESMARWFAGRVHRFERLSVEEPIELLYSLRFGHYP